MYSDKESEIDRSGLWQLGIVFQGVAIALTVFFGRIYVLTYYEVLGIPVYESQMSAINYAIVSPGVTVLGIGLSIVLGSYFLLSGPLARLQLPKWNKFGLGLFLTVTWPVILIVSQNIDTDSVMRSLWIVFSLAMSVHGGVMLGSATGAKAKRDELTSEQRRVEEEASSRLLRGVVAIALVVVYGTFAYSFSSSTARDDAMDALQQSPQATIQFVSGNSGNFRVIKIGEQFVYLLPEESDGLRAVPLNSIEKIDYVEHSESYAQ